MLLKVLCCDVLYREVCLLVANAPHTCDLVLLPRGLHNLGAEKMVAHLQAEIDAAAATPYDAIVLVYGLCNNGVVGLKSATSRLVVPRVHDCIALFLGGGVRYQACFDEHPGTYYRTTGWFERQNSDTGEIDIMKKMGLFVERQKLVEQYGEENADYILETMGDPLAHYDRITFIEMGLECEEPFRQLAKAEAAEKKWDYHEIKGDMNLLKKLIHGNWDSNVLVIEPGQTIQASHDACVMKNCPLTGGCGAS